MGKKSNGKLRRARLVERATQKGVELDASNTYAYMYGTDGSTLRRTYLGG